MWFLIKGSVFFAAVLVVLSYFSAEPAADDANISPLQVADAVSAASGAYQYISAICSERPEVCEKGADTLAVIGVRAKEGARVAYELLDKHFGDGQPALAMKSDPDATPMPSGSLSDISIETPRGEQVATGAIPRNIPVPLKRPTL
jgi:hypothetical protein